MMRKMIGLVSRANQYDDASWSRALPSGETSLSNRVGLSMHQLGIFAPSRLCESRFWYRSACPATAEPACAALKGGATQARRLILHFGAIRQRVGALAHDQVSRLQPFSDLHPVPLRSEERRVGKECRCRWSREY